MAVLTLSEHTGGGWLSPTPMYMDEPVQLVVQLASGHQEGSPVWSTPQSAAAQTAVSSGLGHEDCWHWCLMWLLFSPQAAAY